MVDDKRWAICRAPLIDKAYKAGSVMPSYVDLGQGVGIYALDQFAVNFPLLAERYLNKELYHHQVQDAYDYIDTDAQAYLLYVSSDHHSQQLITLPALPPFAELHIIVAQGVHISLHHDQVSSARIIIHLEGNAQLTFTQSNVAALVDCYTTIVVYQQQASQFIMHGCYTNATYSAMSFFLQEPYAQADVKLALHGSKHIQGWFKTTQIHQAADTKSSLQLRGLLSDDGRSVHKGMIHIEKGAQRSDAYLNSRYLLFGQRAQAYAVPSLEVLEHAVKCGHGSAIGTCDEEQLFYLMSRGITREDAVKLVGEGFMLF